MMFGGFYVEKSIAGGRVLEGKIKNHFFSLSVKVIEFNMASKIKF
jgi:hypothetical protein